MTHIFWFFVARIVALPPIAEYLIRRAKRTPYFDLPGYMNRWWLFNPFQKRNGVKSVPYPRLPSIRVHHILRADLNRHLHDHPWDARSIILKGWYDEIRHNDPLRYHNRYVGDTATLKYGEYHRITSVSEGGVWTLFITYKYRGTWGFLVDGVKVPWHEYESTQDQT